MAIRFYAIPKFLRKFGMFCVKALVKLG